MNRLSPCSGSERGQVAPSGLVLRRSIGLELAVPARVEQKRPAFSNTHLLDGANEDGVIALLLGRDEATLQGRQTVLADSHPSTYSACGIAAGTPSGAGAA